MGTTFDQGALSLNGAQQVEFQQLMWLMHQLQLPPTMAAEVHASAAAPGGGAKISAVVGALAQRNVNLQAASGISLPADDSGAEEALAALGAAAGTGLAAETRNAVLAHPHSRALLSQLQMEMGLVGAQQMSLEEAVRVDPALVTHLCSFLGIWEQAGNAAAAAGADRGVGTGGTSESVQATFTSATVSRRCDATVAAVMQLYDLQAQVEPRTGQRFVDQDAFMAFSEQVYTLLRKATALGQASRQWFAKEKVRVAGCCGRCCALFCCCWCRPPAALAAAVLVA